MEQRCTQTEKPNVTAVVDKNCLHDFGQAAHVVYVIHDEARAAQNASKRREKIAENRNAVARKRKQLYDTHERRKHT